MKKTTALKVLIDSNELEFIMEAHNGMSAKIVEESGFKGIWGSGLTISASFGVRDNNEASWSQVLDNLDFMNDATSLPILLDGDTGYGNFNNARRLVKKLEQRGVAGVCLEDKLFPKTNSFIGGEQQPLADIDEFSGKIKACKDSQLDGDFQVVARVEAFIAGWGLDIALERAHAYADAGADAILMHSKINTAEQIGKFMAAWDGKCHVVIVPTKYYQTPTDDFRKMGVSLVIWANHLMRSAITSMQNTAKTIYEDQSLMRVEGEVASVKEIFRLQGASELKAAEQQYLPANEAAKAIILAASRGSAFGDMTGNIPKTMISYDGKPLLQHQINTYNEANIKDINVVLGYQADAVTVEGIIPILNDNWSAGGIGHSLYKAVDKIEGPTVVSYGDILFEYSVLLDLLGTVEDIVLAVDTSWANGYKTDRDIDAVIGKIAPSDRFGSSRCILLENIGVDINHDEAHGEWIGLIKMSSRGAKQVRDYLQTFYADEAAAAQNVSFVDIINGMKDQGAQIYINYFRGHWLDVDSPEDLKIKI